MSTYPDEFIRDNVVAPSVLVLILIVTLPDTGGQKWIVVLLLEVIEQPRPKSVGEWIRTKGEGVTLV